MGLIFERQVLARRLRPERLRGLRLERHGHARHGLEGARGLRQGPLHELQWVQAQVRRRGLLGRLAEGAAEVRGRRRAAGEEAEEVSVCAPPLPEVYACKTEP